MTIISFINENQGLLLILGMAIFSFSQYFSGKSLKDSTAIESANDTIDILNKRIAAQDVRIKEVEKDIIRLQEQVKIKDDTISQLRAIIDNRTPEFETFIKTINTNIGTILSNQTALMGKPTVQINNPPNAG